MSKLVINARAIPLIPALADQLGVVEALVLQQVHYWLDKSSHEIEGRKWVYNTYKDWQSQLYIYCEGTIKKAVYSLEKKGYLLSGNYNRLKIDKTKWYSINYEALAQLVDKIALSSAQHELPAVNKIDVGHKLNAQAIPESTTKTTTEKRYIPFSEIIQYLNDKTNNTYKPEICKTQELITARWNEGFREEDFKRVIDHKVSEWFNDPNWTQYLRPETLFSTKFESYLNQKLNKQWINEDDFDLKEVNIS